MHHVRVEVALMNSGGQSIPLSRLLQNVSPITHYIHLHEEGWQTIQRNGLPAAPEEAVQDVWRLDPGESVEVAAKFTDYPKSDPADVVRQVLDGIESGSDEVLADEMTREVRAHLGKPLHERSRA